MSTDAGPAQILDNAIASQRIHSAYLLSGTGPEPIEQALRFVRGIVCVGSGTRPCEDCPACRRSSAREEPVIDGAGTKGPLYRHVGDHPDLIWVERGERDTRVRIGQVRALQSALRLRTSEGPRRAAVIADAEWLNQESQNALLRLLEEPPPLTTLVLITKSPAGLLATVRSRCQRVAFPVIPATGPADEETQALWERLDALPECGLPNLLEWASEYQGARAPAATAVSQLLEAGGGWLRDRVGTRVVADQPVQGELEAFATLQSCRKNLVQRNANPRLVAERALFALREAIAR